MITQDRVREVLDYNPCSGIFRWKKGGFNGVNVGDIAGCHNRGGYIQIRIDNKYYKAHRLAVLYMDGYLPETTVDHINRIRDDNRRINLREASMQCQRRNCSVSKNNTSGIKGVRWNKKHEKWVARIAVDAKLKYLGCFTDKLEAAFHRFAAEQCLGFQDCDTMSSALQFIEKA